MVNPGAFRGSRREFLLEKKAEYNRAVAGDYVADAVAKIQREYLKRYPIDLPHDQEPDAAFLAAVNDDAPDPEPEEPNPETMSDSEYRVAVEKAKARQDSLNYRKKQIKRWFAYQYVKDNDVRSKETGAYMPYTTLMKKLTGKDCVRPRLKTPTNVWRKTQRDLIEDHLKAEVELERRLGKTIPATQYAAIRDRIARQIFAELDEGVRREWREKAAAEHRVALAKYKEEINDDPSREPADLQMAIQGMVQFMQPILDMVGAVTGWKVSLLAGGPEPAQGGRLSVISLHSGYTSGDVKMTYGRAERACYKKYVIPSFGSFLKLCYTPEDCRARALPEEEGYMPMSAYENDTDEATFHTIDPDTPSSEAQTSGDAQSQAAASITTPRTTLSSPAPPSKDRAQNATLSVEPPTSSMPATTSVSTSSIPATTSGVVTPGDHAKGAPFTPTSSEGDNVQPSVQQPISSTVASSKTDDCEVYPTQDSMPQDTNPFPFEELSELDSEDAGHAIVSRAPSPLPSAPPSPACSRRTSPAPLSSASRHLENGTPMTDSINTHVVVPPFANAAPAPSVNDPPPPLASEPRSLTEVDNLKVGNSNLGVPKMRKRKSNVLDATPTSGAEPVSKRPRTKTLRAIASEEQSAVRKKRESAKKAGVPLASGKENAVVKQAKTKSSAKAKKV